MSRSIGSHILWKSSYYPIVYKKGIYRLPYFVGKTRTPNWDFVRNLLVRAKIASNLLVASKDRECRTNMASIASLIPGPAMAPCNGCVRSACAGGTGIKVPPLHYRCSGILMQTRWPHLHARAWFTSIHPCGLQVQPLDLRLKS